MSIVADFSVPVEAFCLEETLAAAPAATAEFDKVVAYSPQHVMPFLWAFGTDPEAFDTALTADPTVDTAECTDSFDERYLYHVVWTETVAERLHTILDHEGVILNARGSRDDWRLQVRFNSHDHFDAFLAHFEQFGEITLHQLTSPQTPGSGQYGVSSKQRDALLAAYDAGYYEIPSETSGENLARNFGISQQSFSRRLKRGVAALIESTINRRR